MFDPSTPIWQRRWFQLLLGALVVLATGSFVLPPVLWVIYATRSVLLPVLVAFVLAYAADPLVTWLQAHLRVPRPISAVGLMLGVGAAVAGLALYLGPRLVYQARLLIANIPGYVNQLVDQANLDVDALSLRLKNMITGAAPPRPASPSITGLGLGNWPTPEQAARLVEKQLDPTRIQPAVPEILENGPGRFDAAFAASRSTDSSGWSAANIDLRAITTTVLDWLDVGYEVVASTIGFATYISVACVIIAFCFYFFVWKFRRITHWFVPFIPLSQRERTLEILSMMDRSVAAFIRGRLLQATVVALVLSIGWSPLLADVPYYLLLGIGGGVLNLIPYAAVVAWPLAMLLAWLDALAMGQVAFGLDIWHVFVFPTAVYLIAQGLDGWVIEPLVQGKVTNLEPVSVLLAVLIGGSLAGLLGMLIAIPAAACLRILAQEVILPKLRQWAGEA